MPFAKMNKKRILVLYQDWGNWFLDDYSIFEHWFKEKDSAYDINNDYYVFSLSFKKREPFKKENNITIELFNSTPAKQFYDLTSYSKRLNEIINEYKPDIIYTSFVYLLSGLKTNTKPKTIAFLRDKTAEMIKAKGGIRYIAGHIFYFLDYLALKKIDILLHNGKSLETYAKKLGYKNQIIYNPRDITDKAYYQKAKPEQRMQELKENNHKIILSVGRLVKGKNMQLAIKALAHLPKEYHLFIIGEGEEKEALENIAKKLKVKSRLHLIGFVKHKDLWQYYKGADVFYLLSKTDFEGTPNVLQESLYAKVPSVVSNIPSMKNIIDNNKTGIILNKFDEKELANKTTELINDKAKYERIQEQGYNKLLSIIKQNKEVKDFFK